MSEPTKIFYKGQDADFIVLVEDLDLLQKYNKGDTTLPLIDILSIYKIFVTRAGGSEGVLDEASKAELSNEFGSSDIDKAIKIILKEGESKSSANFQRAEQT